MDRLEAMMVFVTVAEAGTISAGARKLSMPLPTVSRKLAELEAHLHSQLLVRSTRGLTLTEAGLVYLDSCRRILEQIGDAENLAAGEYITPKGRLVLTAPVVFGRRILLPIVCEFLKAYPDIDIHLQLGDRNLNLADEHVDLALRIGALPDSGLFATRIGWVRAVVCASPDHLARHCTLKRPEDLARHPCVTFSSLASADRWTFVQGKKERVISVHSRLHVNTAEAAIDAAIASLGITRVLSYQVAAACDNGDLELALETFEPPALPVNLIFMRQGPLPIKLRAFLDFVTPRLRSHLA